MDGPNDSRARAASTSARPAAKVASLRPRVRVRHLQVNSHGEIALVASRMRATLEEVLGADAGRALYTDEWLRDRARFHVDAARSTGAVFVAECVEDGEHAERAGVAEWLVDPAAQTHPKDAAGAAIARAGIIGHTIVRVERDDGGSRVGVFSTTYVVPSHRRRGVGGQLVARGEAWLREFDPALLMTATAEDNARLVGLFESHGYELGARGRGMVILQKRLAAPAALVNADARNSGDDAAVSHGFRRV